MIKTRAKKILRLNFNHVWQAARRLEAVLPEKPMDTHPQHIKGLDDIVGSYQFYLVGLTGAILSPANAQKTSVIKVVQELQRRGRRFCLVSNNVKKTKPQLLDTLRMQGLDVQANELVTPYDVLPDLMNKKFKDYYTLGVVGDVKPLQRMFKNREWVDLVARPDKVSSVPAILFMDGHGWSRECREHLRMRMLRTPVPVVLVNSNIATHIGGGVYEADSGFYVSELLGTSRRQHDFIKVWGKPSSPVLQKALELNDNMPKLQTVMLGECLHTDILGARQFGIKSVLFDTGYYPDGEITGLCRESSVWPEYVARP